MTLSYEIFCGFQHPGNLPSLEFFCGCFPFFSAQNFSMARTRYLRRYYFLFYTLISSALPAFTLFIRFTDFSSGNRVFPNLSFCQAEGEP
jgi:hypothetical protein